jgi:hypothetical protein
MPKHGLSNILLAAFIILNVCIVIAMIRDIETDTYQSPAMYDRN